MRDDPGIKRQVDDMIVEADAQQFADPAWREELGHWLGQGVFGAPWLMSKMSQLAVTYLNLGQGTAKKGLGAAGECAAPGGHHLCAR
jgi:hypothetical protein